MDKETGKYLLDLIAILQTRLGESAPENVPVEGFFNDLEYLRTKIANDVYRPDK